MTGAIEIKELVDLRNGEYARAAHEARGHWERREAMADKTEGTDDSERKGRCLCCGEWRRIAVMMHVCRECWEEAL